MSSGSSRRRCCASYFSLRLPFVVAAGHADGRLDGFLRHRAPSLHALISFWQAARKCSSTNTRSADDKLPCSRFSSTRLMSALTVRPRAVAISRRACQTVLQAHAGLVPGHHHGSFRDGAGHPLRTVLLLVVHDRPRSQLALNAAIASSGFTANRWWGSTRPALVEDDAPHPWRLMRMASVRPENSADVPLAGKRHRNRLRTTGPMSRISRRGEAEGRAWPPG